MRALRLRKISIFGFLALLFSATPTLAKGKIEIFCQGGGNAYGMMDGKRFPINCGASTPSIGQKSLPAVHPCMGTAFRCMKGKQCIDIQGPYKFHMTNCGSGGSEPNGSMKGAGCVNVPDEVMAQLEHSQGAPFTVHGPGRKSGR